jgi:hypothetical protein
MFDLSKYRAHNIAKRTAVAAGALVALAAMSVNGAQAAPITIPTGLNPGDTYRLAFVTSTTRDATSTDIADYNAFVTAAANSQGALAALATTWTAIASTATVDARDNTNTVQTSAGGSNGVPIFLLNDTELVDGYDNLWDATINTALRISEDGSTLPIPDLLNIPVAWTGTGTPGIGFISGELGNGSAATGAIFLSGPEWRSSLFLTVNTTSNHLYAISGTLTVAAATIPEPGPLSLLALGLVGLGFWRRKRTARTTTA